MKILFDIHTNTVISSLLRPIIITMEMKRLSSYESCTLHLRKFRYNIDLSILLR